MSTNLFKRYNKKAKALDRLLQRKVKLDISIFRKENAELYVNVTQSDTGFLQERKRQLDKKIRKKQVNLLALHREIIRFLLKEHNLRVDDLDNKASFKLIRSKLNKHLIEHPPTLEKVEEELEEAFTELKRGSTDEH